MDMSTFYDTINLTRLQEEALKLQYPPLMLELAMQLYTGPKAISGRARADTFLSRRPRSPGRMSTSTTTGQSCLGKNSAHRPICQVGLMMLASTSQAPQLCKWLSNAVKAYRELHQRLTGLGLKVNPKKTAFIATDKQTEQALKGLSTRT